jgi:crotonobetainyl-CoA:carnitine CoA-transferase CaiB-like acyl-CoA transferase
VRTTVCVMRLGDIDNVQAKGNGKPLDGVRILALEQMQALPFATQLMTRLGAEVLKVENPKGGDLARGSFPAMKQPDGKSAGATFLRNNLNKRSIAIDIKHPQGRELVLKLATQFDVFAENFKGGALKKMGLAYDDVRAVAPNVIYLSVSGFGNTVESPYGYWPAYAAVGEAMSGLYEWKRPKGQPPVVSPVGALGDIGTSLFGAIGLLAALRHRDITGIGQHVDVSMFDSMVAFADVVTNYWSMGERPEPGGGLNLIMDGFPAKDGWFIVQCGREHEFARFVTEIGKPEFVNDPRFATRQGWREHMDVIREAAGQWAADKSSVEACHILAKAGIAAGPVLSAQQVIDDPHVKSRNMLVEMPRTDDVPEPIVVPGNPVKLTGMTEGPDSMPPMLGEHTEAVLTSELGLSPSDIDALRADGVIG